MGLRHIILLLVQAPKGKLRIIHNSRQTDKRHGTLTASELHNSTLHLLRLVQEDSFKEDLNSLKKIGSCSVRLQRLAPFIDNGGAHTRGRSALLRSYINGDKTSHSAASASPCCRSNYRPQLQTKSSLRASVTQAIIAQSYWIISARQIIHSRIFKCINCSQNKPRNTSPLMGDLPAS